MRRPRDVPLDTDLGVSTILVFNRGSADFTDAEVGLARLARPYLANLVATAAAGSWFDSALAALEGIDDTAYGVVLLGPLGRIRVANRAARLLLSAYFRRPAREGEVVLSRNTYRCVRRTGRGGIPTSACCITGNFMSSVECV